jgi:hypothetical protein
MVLAGLFLIAGCGAQSGRTIYTQGANADPVMGTAPQTGMYQLYTAMSPNPTTTVKLKQGDRLGFNKLAGGQIEAVAGDQSVVLPKGTAQAYWKLEEK